MIYSFCFSAFLACLDILGLVLLSQSIGRKMAPGKAILLSLFLITKLGLLGFGLWWMKSQTWFHAGATVAGISIPFAALVVVLVVRNLQRKSITTDETN